MIGNIVYGQFYILLYIRKRRRLLFTSPTKKDCNWIHFGKQIRICSNNIVGKYGFGTFYFDI